MTGKVSFNKPDFETQKLPQDKEPIRKRDIFTRKTSRINLSQKTPIADTAKKIDHTYAEAPHNASSTETSAPHSMSISSPSEDSTIESTDEVGQEVINQHKATPLVHLETFKELFKDSHENEVKIIYLRMCEFANASGTTPDIMVEQLKRGMEIANEIASPDFKESKKEYSANDLAAFDWFIRAQHAKMNKLYLKGATKIPDPENRIAKFILQVRGQNQGNATREIGPYPRGSSHQPENRSQIRETTIDCGEEKICFSKDGKQKLMSDGVREDNIHLYDDVALGIDASGKDVTSPGKDSGTYLFMLLKEGHIPIVFFKAESNSAAPIEGKYGNKSELAKEKLEHGMHLYKKFMPLKESGAFPDLKEDKLPSNILNLLKKIDILKGAKGSVLRESYDHLQKTSELGNNYALPQLKAHLENQRKPDVKLKEDQREKIDALIEEIDKVLEQGQTQSQYPIVPRSREVILPSLQEMLDNKTTFVL